MYYSNNLKKLRLEKNLYQANVAEVAGFTEKSYSNYEKEHDILPIGHLNELANYFGVSLDYLFEFTNKRNYSESRKIINSKDCGNKLKLFRKNNGLTQKDLAALLGCSPTTIAGYESGRYLIATQFLYTICKKYKISADFLLGKIDYDPINQ